MIKICATLCACWFCCLVQREERNRWLDIARMDEVRNIHLVLAGKSERKYPVRKNFFYIEKWL